MPDSMFRIAERILSLPRLSEKRTASILRGFRAECLGRYHTDILLDEGKDGEDRLGLTEESLYLPLTADKPGKTLQAMAALIRFPRLLKAVLRETSRVWDILHGEIDFDDCLVANVIRYASPTAFEFLLVHIHSLRSLQAAKGQEMLYGKDFDKQVRQQWENAMEKVPEEKIAARCLIGFLFAGWNSAAGYNRAKLQRIAHTVDVDYCNRFLAEQIVPSEIPDQIVLKKIEPWMDMDSNAADPRSLITRLLLDVKFAARFEYFGSLLEPKSIYIMAENLFGAVLADRPARVQPDDGIGPPVYSGFLELWRLLLNAQPRKDHEDWVALQVRQALPEDLLLANDIYYYWRHTSHGSVGGKNFISLRAKVVAESKKIFSLKPGSLSECMRDDFPFMLSQFVDLYGRTEEGGPGFEHEDWTWLGRALFGEKVDFTPRLQANLAALVCRTEHVGGGPKRITRKFWFEHERWKPVFGEYWARVLEILISEQDLSSFDDYVNECVQFAGSEAKKFLNKE